MIKPKNLISCIEDLNKSGHIMEECEFIHEGNAYSIKFKKLKTKKYMKEYIESQGRENTQGLINKEFLLD